MPTGLVEKDYKPQWEAKDPYVVVMKKWNANLPPDKMNRTMLIHYFDDFTITSGALGTTGKEFRFEGKLTVKNAERLLPVETKLVEGKLEVRPGSFSIRVAKDAEGAWHVSSFVWSVDKPKE
jgi:hypothetical protein